MDGARLLRHLFTDQASLRRAFPREVLRAIERATAAAESTHRGQLRFAVESSLPWLAVWRGLSSRRRAIEVFSQLRIWDTEQNCGVLIYLLLADRSVEIVADRGIHARVGDEAWRDICRRMESAFRNGRFQEGAETGLREVGELLARHFPRNGNEANELPDAPVVL